MARRTPPPPPPDDFEERILDIDVGEEMRTSFLEYAYSVIYSRALPDARDGLKPVQRRILHTMAEMNLRPDRGHVKSARVVGEVMGRLHPHGDGAIYDALVRMEQPWSLRVPLVDGHGNFGAPDSPPAAMRYTECRMAPAALAMTASTDEDTVDFRANYDSRELEPVVLPAAFPNLLVNGASGIAVGMATNCAPHNLVEVVQALRHLIAHPRATLDDLMRFVPGPDLPTGGKIVGLDGIREAYETGRGSFRMRATTRIDSLTPRRKGIVVTELPYGVGPERVMAAIKAQVEAKKLQGISDVKELTDLTKGMQLVIELKNGFVPEAVLEQLLKLTPMEESFGINAVALVEGQPRTLGLIPLLEVYVSHRFDVVRRRSVFRRGKAADQLHLVQGLILAILDIDEVIQLIRASENASEARTRLMEVFDLTEAQGTHILDMPLRRLTRLSKLELDRQQAELEATIAGLDAILEDERLLRKVVSDELAEVAKTYGTPRRTVLLESAGQPVSASVALEVADDPCLVYLSSGGLLARTADTEPTTEPGRTRHDVVVSAARTTARGFVGVLTSRGRLLRLAVLDLPTLPGTANHPHLQGGAPVSEFVALATGERALGLASLTEDGPGLALGTRDGVVKRVNPEPLGNRDSVEVIRLAERDEVVGAVQLRTGTEQLCFVTSDAQLLHFGADAVRPQGRSGGGIAGVRLAARQRVVAFTAFTPDDSAVVVTVSAGGGTLNGTEPGAVKATPFSEYPAKGRGTGGVRCHRFLKGEDRLVLAWAGPGPARAAATTGSPVELPEAAGRRDGSGVVGAQEVVAVSGPVATLL